MPRRLASACVSALSFAGLLALVGTSVFRADADVLDPTVAPTIAIGDGGALWPTERGSYGRTGRVLSLPTTPKTRWTRAFAGRIEFAPIVAADGGVIVLTSMSGTSGLEAALFDLSPIDGAPRAQTHLPGDAPAAAPILLANGVRVVVAARGDAIGIDPSGKIRFRTSLGGEFASVARVGVVPLPGGGFSVARRSELLELDGSGAIVGRTRLEVTPAIAARDNGDTVAVTSGGELYTWRAGRLPHLVGTFGVQGGGVSPLGVISAQVCPWGPVIDGDSSPAPGGRKERAICVLGSESLVEQIDLATGARRALLGKPLLPFRTVAAVGAAGDLAIGSAGGTVTGVSVGGLDFGPIDLPGTITAPGKDGGIVIPTIGDIPPLVANDGAVLFGATDGVAIARPSGVVVRVARCGGAFASTVAGVSSAGPAAIVIACVDGHVELIGDSGAPTPTTTPSASTDASSP